MYQSAYQITPEMMKQQVSINAQIYYKGPRCDLSGALESIGDMGESYLWENDKQIYSWDGSRLHHDKKNPRTELTVQYENN